MELALKVTEYQELVAAILLFLVIFRLVVVVAESTVTEVQLQKTVLMAEVVAELVMVPRLGQEQSAKDLTAEPAEVTLPAVVVVVQVVQA